MTALLCVSLALSACTLSDSLRHDDFRSVWARPDNKAIEQTVFFATDREAEDSDLGYGPHWSAQSHCGVAQVTIPTAFQPGATPRWAKADKPRTIECDGERDMEAFAQAVLAAARAKNCDRVLLFVHGYNQTFRTALFRSGQLATDTQWACVSVLFSWASEGKFDRYIADVERSGYAVPIMIDILRELQKTGLKVEIVAHSMGNRLTMTSLAALCGHHPTKIVDQLLLVAPDVSAEHDNDDFGHLLRHGAACIDRATIYASNNDLILITSEGVHGGIPRAGRGPGRDLQYATAGLPAPIDIVDASRAPGDPFGHGYFVLSYEMMDDMMWTLAGLPPDKRAAPDALGGPTLVCGDKETPCTRYALKVAPERGPDFQTRLLRRLWPLIFRIQ
ncbi:MAG: alpha/beta hydrolase [Proteobacteria bacterium]|nr:alpha/beta hydrolase [Pseudomonadota bacterium]